MQKTISSKLAMVLAALLLEPTFASAKPKIEAHTKAINIGGDNFVSIYGDKFESDKKYISGGEINKIDKILGAQDEQAFKTYREGDFNLKIPLKNGKYDIEFLFAEPNETQIDKRIFDVIVENQVRIKNLDILKSRDGRPHSALTRTINNVDINDGVLNIGFNPIKGEPLLNGIIIRPKNQDKNKNWKLIWSDEFNEKNINKKDWGFEIWPSGKVNNEAQEYTDNPQNARIENGQLIIEAHKNGDKYNSARLFTKPIHDLTYGKIEVRAKLPVSGGTWPAIWMLPADPYYYATNCKPPTEWQGAGNCDAWPNSGEIDIMEHVGNGRGIVHGTVHSRAYYWVNWQQRKGSVQLDDLENAYHVYAMEWDKKNIKLFVDDSLYFHYIKEDHADWHSWPFDKPFRLIINLAIGGMWGAADGGIDDTKLPQQFKIDYVRYYKHK